jgi:hypothetical protein
LVPNDCAVEELASKCAGPGFCEAVGDGVGAEYSAVHVDQGFRDTVLNDPGIADGTACGSLSLIWP